MEPKHRVSRLTKHILFISKTDRMKKTKSAWWLLGGLAVSLQFAHAQAPKNWFNLDYNQDKVYGVSTERMYKELLKGKTGQPVIVAVIDSGIEVDHEDLKEVLWVNPKEIPNNGIDDDKNGYVDDIHGWSFLGNSKGENVQYDNLEVTRIVARFQAKCDKADLSKLTGTDKADCTVYQEAKSEVDEKYQEAKANLGQMTMTANVVKNALSALEKEVKDKPFNDETIGAINAGSNQMLSIALNIYANVAESGKKFGSFSEFRSFLLDEIEDGKNYYEVKSKYHYNTAYNSRPIVGDNYENVNEKGYGNNLYEGPDAHHGTHVAGIIAALRTNDKGIMGVADNARIMALRAVPDGDERDKDVANAIYYAVDNGAKVINMSFGKGHSPYKEAVDKAIQYAESKDVLLVHAAGNDSENNDDTKNFPVDWFGPENATDRSKRPKNMIEVGALNWKTGEELVAPFSNYGKKEVDLFAPGVAIHSTVPDGKYEDADGTSMAAPVVSGVAAVIRSYFPHLSAVQVKEVLAKSSVKLKDQVLLPGAESETVSFTDLSITGGIVNAYEAVKLAMTLPKTTKPPTKPLKKPKKPRG